MQNQDATTSHWFKEPMFYLVAGIPFVAVIWGFIMLSMAMNTRDSLVSDSYYKDGRSYTENMDMDNTAKRLAIQANIRFTTDDIYVDVVSQLDNLPATLQLEKIHPTLQEYDAHTLLQRLPSGKYVGLNDIELPQRRHLWLSSPEQGWRVRLTQFIEANETYTFSAL
ncbi:MAG: FixH family protein [Bacterioplanes sp.]|nr:FixH family protein [Bacterioplanes sp.]